MEEEEDAGGHPLPPSEHPTDLDDGGTVCQNCGKEIPLGCSRKRHMQLYCRSEPVILIPKYRDKVTAITCSLIEYSPLANSLAPHSFQIVPPPPLVLKGSTPNGPPPQYATQLIFFHNLVYAKTKCDGALCGVRTPDTIESDARPSVTV